MKRRKRFSPFVLGLYAGLLLLPLLPAIFRPGHPAPLDALRPAGAPTLLFAAIPAGTYPLGSAAGRSFEQPERRELEGFRMLIHEVRVADFICFLNQTARDFPDSPQITRLARGYRAGPGQARLPVTRVDYPDAEAYAAWLGQHTGRSVRLPTEAEWESAARGGLAGGVYPCGWREEGGHDALRSQGGRANGYGLYDMAGNVYEWCIPDPGQAPKGLAAGRGGSWAERDAKMQTVYARAFFDRAYRDIDMGFRVVMTDE